MRQRDYLPIGYPILNLFFLFSLLGLDEGSHSGYVTRIEK